MPNSNSSLIKRFNQHSTMVLKSCDRRPFSANDSSKVDDSVAVNGTTEPGGNDSHISKDVHLPDKQVKRWLFAYFSIVLYL